MSFKTTIICMATAAFVVSGCVANGKYKGETTSTTAGNGSSSDRSKVDTDRQASKAAEEMLVLAEESIAQKMSTREGMAKKQAATEKAKDEEAKKGGAKKGQWVVITPLTTLSTRSSEDAKEQFSGAYTRLAVTSISCSDELGAPKNCNSTPPYQSGQSGESQTSDANQNEKSYEKRNWLARWLWGVRHTINLTSKVTVGSFTATVPLVTIDHISNRTDGEAYTRIVHHSAQNYPLFLVKGDGSNGVVSLKFEVKASDETQPSVAGTVIQVAQNVAKAVAPQSTVLTTLTQQSTKDVAAALDKALGQVLATSVDEQQWVENDIRHWGNGAAVTFKIPNEQGVLFFSSWDYESEFKTVGSWTVKFATPRPSIFSDVQICDKSPDAPLCEANFRDAAIRAEEETENKSMEVLSFQLVNGAQSLGTISSYLKQQDWWATAQKAFATPAAENATDSLKDSTTDFCRSIKNTIAGLNLNSVDAGIVVVAVRNGAILPPGAIAAMKSNVECSRRFTKNDDLNAFTPTSGTVGTVVTVTGTNLAGATDVKFNGTSAGVPMSATATSIAATVPAGATTGLISVTTPEGTVTPTELFKVLPEITSVVPTISVAGTSVTISGTNLKAGTTKPTVKIGNVVVPVSSAASTAVVMTVPSTAVTGVLSVTTTDGTAVSANPLDVIKIASFTPTSGRAGTVVTVTGMNLTSATQVKFNGVSAGAPMSVTATSLQTTVPVGATTGTISVVTPHGTAASSINFTVK